MTFSELGSLGEFISSIAVVISLIYLAVQIRGQRSEQKQQSLQTMWNAWNETGRSLVDDPSVAELVIKGSRHYEDLDAAEKMRFGTFFTRWLKALEPLYYLYEDGVLHGDAWKTTEFNIELMIKTPGFHQYWTQSGKRFFRPEFQIHVEEIRERH